MIALSYDDVTLIPRYSEIESRSDVDTSVEMLGGKIEVPIIGASMDTVTGIDMAIALRRAGAIGALHRFWSIDENVVAYQKIRDAGADCIATLGVKDWHERGRALFDAGARRFLIDIAHGHSASMQRALKGLRSLLGTEIWIVAGNVATADATIDLINWGANVVKCGVGPGAACSTRVVTGHGVPMFSCVVECAVAAKQNGAQLIADGGIRSPGDVVKAFVAGADAVMIGSMFARCIEAPGERTTDPVTGRKLKTFRGMATNGARRSIGLESSPAPEGVDMFVEEGGTAASVIDELQAGLRSGMSYAGARTLTQLRDRGRWVQQTVNGRIEGEPRFLR